VQKVFEEQHQAMETQKQAQLEQNFTDRLKQAVQNGKLTQSQADLITQKRAQLKAERENSKANSKAPQEMTDTEKKLGVKQCKLKLKH